MNPALIAVLSAPRRPSGGPVPPDPPRDPWWRRALDEIRWRLGL